MPSFFNDEQASLEIPLRLVVYVILTAAILAVTAIGLTQIWQGITTDIMEKQVGDIRASLITMQSGGARNLIDPDAPSGNIRTLSIKIPERVDYLAFGADPDPDNDYNLTNTPIDLMTDTGNVIFYRSKTGKIRIPLDGSIELREGLLENGKWVVNNMEGRQYGAVISGKGDYELTFELVYDPIYKEKYTIVHFTDDLNAYINPYEATVLPNNIWISLNPKSIPDDGVTPGEILVKLKDKRGRDAIMDGIKINLSASMGNLSTANLTTVKGKAKATITSDVAGTSIITATSPGLNPGSIHLTVIPKPIIIEFKKWIYNEEEILNGQFFTDRELKYGISLKGYGTRFSVPYIGEWWPNASIMIDGVRIGEGTVDSESMIHRDFNQTTLLQGNHSINISLKKDKYLPLFGDTDIFVEEVLLSAEKTNNT